MDQLPLAARKARKIPAKIVAENEGVSAGYFILCIKAAGDERLRLSQRIPQTTIDRLPLKHWERMGRGWFITESNLVGQM